MNNSLRKYRLFFIPAMLLAVCGCRGPAPSREAIEQLKLKRGQVVLCGAAEFGKLDFEIGSANRQVREDFNTGVELLHSFEYDEAEKVFAKIIDESPACVMAYWGVAMSCFHPLWEPPGVADLQKGSAAIAIARSMKRSARESAYIDAAAAYYDSWDKTDAHSRCVRFEKAMSRLHDSYPEDREAVVFYALALDASADPADKSYAHQRQAGRMLDSLYALAPDHPGVVHYIIHTYDYPGLAELGLPAARRYAAVAPASAHALHMPSHIFTRLGLWDESIQLNIRSVDAARCYAQQTGIKGHWDEELHGLDYLIYAYLQKGDGRRAKEQLDYLATNREVHPINSKGAYTFAAAPSRWALENKNWAAAARLTAEPATFPWSKYPWQEAIVHFGRLLGLAHSGDIAAAEGELAKMDSLHEMLVQQHDDYKAKQVEIQLLAGRGWIAHAGGRADSALILVRRAAEMEDSTSKPPVTPGEVLPAREIYADLLFEERQFGAAFQEYLTVLQKSPNRFNSLFGAGRAAELSGDASNAKLYYTKLIAIADPQSDRPELSTAKAFLK